MHIHYRTHLGLFIVLCSVTGINILAGTKNRIIDVKLLLDKAQPLRQNCFGANNNLLYPPFTYSQSDFADKYMEAHRPFFRYPGGTGANYLNPLTGISEPRDNTTKARKNNNKKLEDPDEFFRFTQKTGAQYSLVMNMCTVTLQENRQWLEGVAQKGIRPEFFELGNELYFGSYSRFYADGQKYCKAAKEYAAMIRSIFPKAKIGVVISSHYYSQESFLPDDKPLKKHRHEMWIQSLRNEDFYDAVVIHTYSHTGMDSQTAEADFLPFQQAYMRAISHADNQLKSSMQAVKKHFPVKAIWVTEYGVGGFSTNLRKYRLRYSYIGMLHSSVMLMKFLSIPEIEVSSWHSFIQFLRYPKNSAVTDKIVFQTKNGYEQFRLIGYAVRQSDAYIPVALDGIEQYEGEGKYKGSYPELEAGCFIHKENGSGRLILLNKSTNTYRLGSIQAVRNSKIHTVSLNSVIMLMPRQDVALEKAIGEEDVMTMKKIKTDETTPLEIIPYSLTSLEFKRSKFQ